jgi:hypothetical protein
MQSMGQTAGETATLSFMTCAVPAWCLVLLIMAVVLAIRVQAVKV